MGKSKKAAVDNQAMKLIQEIEELKPSIKDKLFYPANAIICDTKQAKRTHFKTPKPWNLSFGVYLNCTSH
jgi:hypothetical protein